MPYACKEGFYLEWRRGGFRQEKNIYFQFHNDICFSKQHQELKNDRGYMKFESKWTQ